MAPVLAVALLLPGACERDHDERPGATKTATEFVSEADAPRIFVARRIRTLDPDGTTATAVAVADGRIAAVGDLASVRAAMRSAARSAGGGREAVVDRRFEDLVLLPGFVDNHLHPIMAAVLLPMAFATPDDWSLPGREVEGVHGREAYLARLRELSEESPDGWLFAWGHHPDFHGPLARADLDAISSVRPIVAWHRSFHEIVANGAALEAMGFPGGAPPASRQGIAGHPQIDWPNGHFYETGLQVAMDALAPVLLAPERLARGLATLRETLHRGGITTVADMAAGLFDLETEWQLERAVLDDEATPFRVLLVPDGRRLGQRLGDAQALALVRSLPERNTHRLRFVRQVKLFADGAFYSQLMQMLPPGYTDGHHGEWIMSPEALEASARVYWDAGVPIHVHVNGDLGTRVTLDVLEKLQAEAPRRDHRFALHHYGASTPEQAGRAARLGAVVSANPYYLYVLGDAYARRGLGPERAAHMVRLGSLVRAGVPVSLHSDFTMAPARPLLLAWVAANRRTDAGTLMAPEERISVEQALRAITLDAAYAIRMEDEIGSIEPGKRADFVVLGDDPMAVPPGELRDVPVLATVFEGRVFPIVD